MLGPRFYAAAGAARAEPWHSQHDNWCACIWQAERGRFREDSGCGSSREGMEMGLKIEPQNGRKRFEALLSGASGAAQDRPLLVTDDWLVAPTLGAVVPGWLIALPRRPVLSFRDWARTGGLSALGVVSQVCTRLGLRSDEVIWFEHGPAQAGTLVGCGLDHAHVHILIRPAFSFEAFALCAQASAPFSWVEDSATESWSALPAASSYLIAGSGDRGIRALNVETAGSQFFRRVVASVGASGADWDYRRTAHVPNILSTISLFRSLEDAARRER